MKYVQLLYHYQINSLNLFVKDITAFIEIHQFICFLQAFKQWGKGHDTQTIIFPIAFTQQAFCCIVTPIGGGQGSDRVYSLSVKSFQILCGTNNDGLWLALGI